MDFILDDFKEYPVFSLETVEFLKTPEDFFQKILSKFQIAIEINCKTLSFGTKEKSLELIKTIKMRKKDDKKTTIIIDKNRGTRNKDLSNLIKENNIQECFEYYQTKENFLLPNRIKELVSVLHSKIYLFDQYVLLSGANLDDSYFINRMDRYMLFKDSQFSQYLKHKHFDNKSHIVNPFRDLKAETYIFEFEHTNEICVLKKLMKYGYNEILLSTAYLNFSKEHYSIFENLDMKIVTCSKKSNTFNLDTFLEKFVNEEYTLSAIDVVRKLTKCEFFEYDKKDYTFHCKGLWAFNNDFAITVIGSTNFNVRSISRDIESNFCLITKNQDIIKALRDEIQNIMKDSKKMTLESLESRKIGFLSKIGKPASKKFL